MDWKQQNNELSDNNLPLRFKSSRRTWNRKSSSQHSTSITNAVSTLFNKQFEITNDNYTLPAPEMIFNDPPWQIDDLQNLKTNLNDVKSRLNDYNLVEWRSHTRKRNQAGDIKWRLQREINPEFLTQAWCKFYEILSSYPLLSQTTINRGKFKSVHLCEAPGAFVTSLNHWLKLNAPLIDWKWTATTLNPYYEGNSLSCMINDDRFILHTLEHWYFGGDNTGNLMKLKNLDDFIEWEKQDANIISLITADGSIDCLDMPEEQESIVSQLHYCETIASLHLLQQHGTFVLKLFTFFEYQTVCLIYLLSCCFNKIFIKKPATSKEGNSEVYIVCLDFKGQDYIRPYLSAMRQYYENGTVLALFRKIDIPNSFIEQIVNIGQFFKYQQCQVIIKNINTFDCEDYTWVKKIKRAAADYFIVNCGLQRLDTEDLAIVGAGILSGAYCQVMDNRIFYNSYNDRQKKDHMTPRERLFILIQELNCYGDTENIFNFQVRLLKLF